MCGRYTVTAPGDVLAETFGVTESIEGTAVAEMRPRYNVAPTQDLPIVGLNHEGGRSLGLMRWGLIPGWAKDPSIGNRMINARSETVAEKPAFRSSFKKRRCLAPADGFYEWKKIDKRKQPYYIHLKGGGPFAFAALWSRWRQGEGEPIHSYCLLTTGPNGLMKGIHDRMPVILKPEHYDLWLDPEVEDPEVLLPLLGPYPEEEMEAWPVSTLVNRPTNDVPACIRPLNEEPPGDSGEEGD